MSIPPDPSVRAYYEHGQEHDRLASPVGQLEFVRTQEILRRHLPSAGATVADIGGGSGRYGVWLAEEGYRVLHRDLMPLHVDQARALAAQHGLSLDSEVADARALSIEDEAVDAVLLLGPLYHLPDRRDRITALREARRIVRPGSPVFVAAISRWAPLLDGVLVKRIDRDFPVALALVDEVQTTGILPPLFPGDFSGFCHRPDELRSEGAEAELECLDLVSVEGLAFALADLDERWDDPADRARVLDSSRRIERVPELLGLGPHLLLTARRGSA
jgi:SAM-dependent methyltransferase